MEKSDININNIDQYINKLNENHEILKNEETNNVKLTIKELINIKEQSNFIEKNIISFLGSLINE